MPPEVVFLSQMFCTTGLVQNKLHKEEIHFLKSYLNRVSLLPGWMCGPSLRRVGQGILELMNGNGMAHLTPITLTFDPVTPKSIGFLLFTF